MKVNRFSLLNVLDIVSRVLMFAGFVLIWRRLHQMDERGTAMMNAAAFERQLLANYSGIDLKTAPFVSALS